MIGGQLELREVHLAQAEVAARVEGAPVGDRAGVGEQPLRLALGLAEPGEPGDLLGDLGHLLAGLEVALGVAAVDVPPVQRHQPAGRVEDVDGGRVAAVGVAHRVAQHRPDPGPARQPGHPGGVRGGARPPGAAVGAAAREPVGDQLGQQVGARHELAPRGQRGQAEVVAAAPG